MAWAACTRADGRPHPKGTVRGLIRVPGSRLGMATGVPGRPWAPGVAHYGTAPGVGAVLGRKRPKIVDSGPVWPYWSVDLPGLSEADARRVIAWSAGEPGARRQRGRSGELYGREMTGRSSRVAAATSLVVGLVGVAVFGSYVLAIGGDAEGRDFETVAPWALPGLALAALTAAVAVAVPERRGHWLAVALALAVTASIVLLYVLNLPVAPPVP